MEMWGVSGKEAVKHLTSLYFRCFEVRGNLTREELAGMRITMTEGWMLCAFRLLYGVVHGEGYGVWRGGRKACGCTPAGIWEQLYGISSLIFGGI